MDIFRIVKCFLALTVLLLLSCSGNPGYSVRIYIEKSLGMSLHDMHLVTDVMKSRPFESVMIKEDGLWRVASYKIKLEDEKFNAFHRKYIRLAVESRCAPKVSSGKESPCKVEVRISNPWEGRDPILKAEIDSLTDQIIENLSKKVTKSELEVKRYYSSPM